MKYEWNEEKNKSNIKKHDVSFEVAIGVFQDPYRLELYDEEHSGYNSYGFWEDRYVAIGYINNILYVVYTIRNDNNEEIIRIISARQAVESEIEEYIKNRGAF